MTEHKPGLVDIGANLSHESFRHDLDRVIAGAREAGVEHVIVTGTDLESIRSAGELCRKFPAYLTMTAGFHPHVASRCSDAALSEVREYLQKDQVVAVGETGLDFNRDYSPRDVQEKVFSAHLELAAGTGKPLFLHQRDAHERFYPILKQYRDAIGGGVVHCFTDTREALRDYLNLDMYIGITGWVCDERRGVELRQLLRYIPRERLLLETDAPYLLPRSLRPRPGSRRNEPRFLTEVLRVVALYSEAEEEAIARQTTANACRLFNLALQP